MKNKIQSCFELIGYKENPKLELPLTIYPDAENWHLDFKTFAQYSYNYFKSNSKYCDYLEIVKYYFYYENSELYMKISNIIGSEYSPFLNSGGYAGEAGSFLIVNKYDVNSPVYLYNKIYYPHVGLLQIFDNFDSMIETSIYLFHNGMLMFNNSRIIANSLVEIEMIMQERNPQSNFYTTDLLPYIYKGLR